MRARRASPLRPVTYRVNSLGHAEVGGCDLLELAGAHGTPLYVYDEETVRVLCREYVAAIGDRGDVLYSAKAFGSPGFLRVVASEGLGLDVVSAGELEIALRSGYPTEGIHFLDNNKSVEDVEAQAGCGVDQERGLAAVCLDQGDLEVGPRDLEREAGHAAARPDVDERARLADVLEQDQAVLDQRAGAGPADQARPGSEQVFVLDEFRIQSTCRSTSIAATTASGPSRS